MKLINSPLSLRNSALTAALIFISTLIYSNISCAREGLSPQYAEMMKEMQRAMQLQQQAQGQFDKDLENANNDYDSKYTRMSDIELRSLMQKGDRGAIAEYILRMQQGSREKLVIVMPIYWDVFKNQKVQQKVCNRVEQLIYLIKKSLVCKK